MTRDAVRTWLQSRQPSPPATLAVKLCELVAAAPDSAFAGDSMSSVMAALGRFTLNRQPSTPDQALALLAADAFVTYSFEAASDEGTDATVLARHIIEAVGA